MQPYLGVKSISERTYRFRSIDRYLHSKPPDSWLVSIFALALIRKINHWQKNQDVINVGRSNSVIFYITACSNLAHSRNQVCQFQRIEKSCDRIDTLQIKILSRVQFHDAHMIGQKLWVVIMLASAHARFSQPWLKEYSMRTDQLDQCVIKLLQ